MSAQGRGGQEVAYAYKQGGHMMSEIRRAVGHTRRARLVRSGLITALSSLIITATAQASPRLLISHEGAPYTGENVTEVSIVVSPTVKCLAAVIGSTAVDSGRRVIDTFDETLGPYCHNSKLGEGPYTLETALSKVVVRWTGLMTVVGHMDVKTPGPCDYRFTNITAFIATNFEAGQPSPLVGNAQAVGVLRRKESNSFCPGILTSNLAGLAINATSGDGEPLEAELLG
jgi:hypothetical protein